MARMARLVVPNFPHHVTQRGNRRQKTFFCANDYRYYIELIAEYAQQTNTEIWAYCLMPNHVHLVMIPSTEDGLRATLGNSEFISKLEIITGPTLAPGRPGPRTQISK